MTVNCFICVLGVDGRYSEGMREFANYLLFDIYEPRQQHSLQVFSSPLFNLEFSAYNNTIGLYAFAI